MKIISVYVEIFEWLNFRKKLAISNFENIIFENEARVELAVIVVQLFQNLIFENITQFLKFS